MIQPQKRGFRKPEDFVAAAEHPPERALIDGASNSITVLTDPQEGQGGPAENLPGSDAPAGDAKPLAPLVDAVMAPSAPVAPAKTKAKAKPWDDASPKVKVPFMMRLPEALHLKLRWIDENLPKSVSTSIHATILQGAEKEVARILKEHFPDKE